MIIFFTPYDIQCVILKHFHIVVDEEIVNPDRMYATEVVGSTERTENEFR
jgi:hypothetical protein